MMKTPWIDETSLEKRQSRNEAFWKGELEETPLMWLPVPDARPARQVPVPATEEELWTDVDYVIEAAEASLAATHFGGDALPTHHPWLGPDQFVAWLGGDLILKPREFTSWIAQPPVKDWAEWPEFKIDPDNRWWKLYLEIVRRSAEVGRDKWAVCYPDLHTGIDALSALRGPEVLAMDLITNPEAIHRAMNQMTDLFKEVCDQVSDIILPTGQGVSNWTGGWSASRCLCIGQNDFSCMISPEMFNDFCLKDNVDCIAHVDRTIHHMDGPGCARHVDTLLELDLDCIQWIQGDGNPPPSQWLDLLRRIQAAGKSVQVFYTLDHTGKTDMFHEVEVLCRELDPTRLFIYAMLDSVEKADALESHARQVCRAKQTHVAR